MPSILKSKIYAILLYRPNSSSVLKLLHLWTIGLLALLLTTPSYSASPQTQSLVSQALIAEDSGQTHRAIRLYKQVLAEDPTSFEATNSIAGLYGALGDYSQQVIWAQKAIKLSPNDYKGYINLGNGYGSTGKIREAELAFTQANKLAPNQPIPFYSLGLVAEQRGDKKAAIQFYERSIKADSKFEAGYLNLSALYANQGKFDSALSVLNQLLKVDPKNKDALSMKGQIKATKN